MSARELQEELLERIRRGATQCAEIERQLKANPAPAMETLIQLHRLLVLEFSLKAKRAPELLRLVKELMRPVVEWAQLEERRRLRELAEQKYRDEAAARAKENRSENADALRPETLEKIEGELNLL